MLTFRSAYALIQYVIYQSTIMDRSNYPCRSVCNNKNNNTFGAICKSLQSVFKWLKHICLLGVPVEVTEFYNAKRTFLKQWFTQIYHRVYQVAVAVLTVKLHVTIVLSMLLTCKKGGNFVSIMYMWISRGRTFLLKLASIIQRSFIWEIRSILKLAPQNPGQSENLRGRTTHRKPLPPSPCKISKGDINDYFW